MEKNSLKNKCKLLVIGGSAGSLSVLLDVLPGLNANLSFPVIIVLHRKSSLESVLKDLFASKTTLQVIEAEEKERLLAGHIYIAPADYHLLVEKDKTISLDFSEKVNFSRPSIDVAFETAAEAYGSNLACMLLSGASSDGAQGLKFVKSCGGLTIVQSPDTAEVAYMPQQAIAEVDVDVIIDTKDMATFINTLSS